MSDVTPPTRGNGSIKDQGKVSKVLKFRSRVTTGKGDKSVAPSLIHTHWIDAIQEAFGSDVDIINNKNQKLNRIDLLKWTNNPLQHHQHFKIHRKSSGRDPTRKTTAFILHRIQTNESISNIKNLPKIQKILKDNNCYLTEHHWDETVWDTAMIGFVTNIDPGYYTATQAHTKFLTALQTRKSEINDTRVKIKTPKFKMIFSSPTTYLDQNTRVSTKAYSIEVQQSDQLPMMQVLKSLFSDNLSAFVPYTMRYKFPEGFTKAIKYQTWLITNNRTIVLQNISESAMYYMEAHIKAIKGVKDVLPANDVKHSGRHNILTEKNEFDQVRNQLMKSLPNWYNKQVPTDALPNEGTFPGSPCVRPIHRDCESSGENSWVSRSSASFMSMDLSMVQNDEYFVTGQEASNAFTYAAVVTMPKAAGKDDEENKEIISDITGTRSESASHKHKLEIEQLLEKQRQERSEVEAIMAAQQAEIQRLTEANQRANMAYEEVTAELRAQQAQVSKMITEKLSIADKKRNEEMEAMRHEMMTAMKEMIQKTQHNASATNSHNQQPKRTQQGRGITTDDEETYNTRQEKRANRRNTPTKKLIFDEEHLAEGLMTQHESHQKHESDDASSVSE
jgi:hypothetical protein